MGNGLIYIESAVAVRVGSMGLDVIQREWEMA
jgi:hypothetical protein